MPLRLYYDWRAYCRINPLLLTEHEQARHDWNAGLVAATFANVMTGLWAKNRTRYRPGDLMYHVPTPEERQPKTSKELYNIFKSHLFLNTPEKGGGN